MSKDNFFWDTQYNVEWIHINREYLGFLLVKLIKLIKILFSPIGQSRLLHDPNWTINTLYCVVLYSTFPSVSYTFNIFYLSHSFSCQKYIYLFLSSYESEQKTTNIIFPGGFLFVSFFLVCFVYKCSIPVALLLLLDISVFKRK